MTWSGVLTLAVGLAAFAGCSDNPRPVNPSFRITYGEADRARVEMSTQRRPLPRPLVIVSGYLDFFASRANLARRNLRTVIDDDRVLVVDAHPSTYPEMRQALIDAVDKAFPTDDPDYTTEVDVIGQSIGGLVASYAAAPSQDPARPRRLRVARLFAVSTPFRGSSMARRWGFTAFHRSMTPGSPFIGYVDACAARAAYEVVPYVLLGDSVIGVANAAPRGATPFWLSTQALFPHPESQDDKRIYIDIARRLRGETPFSTPPPAPLPDGP
jgi:pimeloyl-ACP methyl ester carboxylesterase